MEKGQRMGPISPSCLAKIVKEAVEYAQAFGFVPHPDYRHASMLLEGIDLSTCPTQFTFGRDGKPFYVQGPHESFAQAAAISQRLQAMGGHYLVQLPEAVVQEHPEIEGLFGEPDSLDEDNSPEESP